MIHQCQDSHSVHGSLGLSCASSCHLWTSSFTSEQHPSPYPGLLGRWCHCTLVNSWLPCFRIGQLEESESIPDPSTSRSLIIIIIIISSFLYRTHSLLCDDHLFVINWNSCSPVLFVMGLIFLFSFVMGLTFLFSWWSRKTLDVPSLSSSYCSGRVLLQYLLSSCFSCNGSEIFHIVFTEEVLFLHHLWSFLGVAHFGNVGDRLLCSKNIIYIYKKNS
jgi:hypothetical protein